MVAHGNAATCFTNRQYARFDSPSNLVIRTIAVAGAAHQGMAIAIFAVAIAQHVLKFGHDQASDAPRVGLVDETLEVFSNQFVVFNQCLGDGD